MQLSIILAVAVFSISTHAQYLLDALVAANATRFAQFLRTNPSLLAVYNSSTVQTVFAPTDAYFNPLQRRDTASTQSLYLYQYSGTLVSHYRSNTFPSLAFRKFEPLERKYALQF